MNKYIEDIDYMLNELEKNHLSFYFRTSKQAIYKLFDQIKSKGINNETEFIYAIRLLLKLINDPHTYVSTPIDRRIFPFDIKIIENKAVIVAVYNEKFKKYIGSIITSINGKAINDILAELEKIIVYDNSNWLRYQQEFALSEPFELSLLPIFANANNWEFTLLSPSGEKAIMVDGYSEKELNTSIANKQQNMTIKVLEEHNAIYIVYNRCREKSEGQMQELINNLAAILMTKSIGNVIIDIRGNTGGNSEIIRPLIDFLTSHNLNIIALIDHGVFSSGIMAALYLKTNGAILIGTSVGEDQNSFGECKYIELPNSKIKVSYSTKYFYYDPESNEINYIKEDKKAFEDFAKNPKNQVFFKPFIIDPDIDAIETYEDFINGKDVVLQAAIARISEQKNNPPTP